MDRPVGMRHVAALAAALLLALVLTDPGGFLSSDVGGKVATLEAMDERGDWSPDLGYWAEDLDPDGSLYPMWSTNHVDGRWVNTTSLPMVYAARPLYRVGGAKLAGVIPLLGTVAAAAAAAGLAKEIGGRRRETFWIVGAASPLTVYALDLWEHSIGVAAMVLAVTLTLRASRAAGSWTHAALAGLLFGIAASMRQEALVYGFASGLALSVRLFVLARSEAVPIRLLRVTVRGGAMVIGALAAMVANTALESTMIGGDTRTGRSTGTVVAAGADVGVRIREAIITGTSPFGSSDTLWLALALTTAALLVALGRASLSPDADEAPARPFVIGLVAVAGLVSLDFVVDGLRFVPGLTATTPVAVLGLSRAFHSADRAFVSSVAIGSLPLVWATQFTGGATPQWGGRYILTTGTLLVAVATAVLVTPRSRQMLLRVAGAGLAITMIGVVFTIHRTASFADAMDELAARPEAVVVFSDSHLSRQGGVHTYRNHWLAAPDDETRAEVADVLEQLDVGRVAYVQPDRGESATILAGWEVVGEERVPLINDLYLLVSTQEPTG